MKKIRLKDGVWSNAAGAIIAASGVVAGSTADQIAYQYTGWAGMALGLGLLAWGVTVNGNQWWRQPRLGFQRDSGATMPLAFVVRYLAHHAQWGDGAGPRSSADWIALADEEITRRLADGSLIAWGTWKPQHGPKDNAPRKIRPAEWLGLQWDSTAMVDEGALRSHAFRWSQHPLGGGVYSKVKVDPAQVQDLWPRRGAISRAFRASLAAKKGLVGVWRQQNAHLPQGTEFFWK